MQSWSYPNVGSRVGEPATNCRQQSRGVDPAKAQSHPYEHVRHGGGVQLSRFQEPRLRNHGGLTARRLVRSAV